MQDVFIPDNCVFIFPEIKKPFFEKLLEPFSRFLKGGWVYETGINGFTANRFAG